MNLLAMAQSGLDAGTAQSQATSSLQNNLLAGESTATADSFANAFGDLGTVYQNSEDQKAARQGQIYGYGSLFNTGQQQQVSPWG
jgi:hypothetical protein